MAAGVARPIAKPFLIFLLKDCWDMHIIKCRYKDVFKNRQVGERFL